MPTEIQKVAADLLGLYQAANEGASAAWPAAVGALASRPHPEGGKRHPLVGALGGGAGGALGAMGGSAGVDALLRRDIIQKLLAKHPKLEIPLLLAGTGGSTILGALLGGRLATEASTRIADRGAVK